MTVNGKKVMRIMINGRVLSERMGGPARYIKNIIYELSRIDKKNLYYILIKKEGYNFDFALPENFEIVRLSTNNRFVFDYILLPWFTWKRRIDASIFPKNTYSPLARGQKIPVYHDIIYFEKELDFREFKYFDQLHHRLMIPVAAKFSAYDLTVSDFTAGRMKELLGINGKKIRIIKEGVESRFRRMADKEKLQSVINKYGLIRPFFFYSGSLSPRKNIASAIRAYRRLCSDIPHRFYITGPDSWNNSEREVFRLIDDLGLSDKVKVLGLVSDDELVALYTLADCDLYPSLYEGFGLPILEAQACGCPVITSNVASCPEVAGDGALYVDPMDESSIADAMSKLIGDRKLRDMLIQNGLKNIQRFSWSSAAKGILELMEECDSR